MMKALDLFYNDNGVYPNQGLSGGVCASDWGCWSSGGGGLADSLAPYLKTLPQDPYFSHRGAVSCGGGWYAYVYQRYSDNRYCLAATLENAGDPDAKSCAQSCHSNWPNYYVLYP